MLGERAQTGQHAGLGAAATGATSRSSKAAKSESAMRHLSVDADHAGLQCHLSAPLACNCADAVRPICVPLIVTPCVLTTMLLPPTCNVIDWPAVMVQLPALTVIEWLPCEAPSGVSLPVETVTELLPCETVSELLPLRDGDGAVALRHGGRRILG